MSTYQELKGLKVKYLSSDTSGDRVKEGEVFYNSTDFKLKSFVSTAAWHSGANLSTAKNAMGGFGILTAAVSCGGKTPPTTNATEEYNGSGWSTGGNYPISTSESGAAGTLTAGLMFGGQNPPETNVTGEYDGSSWTAGGNLNTARTSLTGAGTQTAGLASGGTAQPNSSFANVEEYNGTSWSEVTDIPTARGRMGGAGKTQTAALIAGGGPPATTNSFEYDGTNWTAGGSINVARYGLRGNGTQTSALVYGGDTGSGTYVTASTESYDGSSFSTTANLGTAKVDVGSAGADNTSGVAFGGATFPNTSATEEFTVSVTATTGAAWASGGNLNTGRYGLRGTGTQTSMVVAGGNIPPNSNTNVTEEYNGSSWSNSNNLPAVIQDGNMCGTQTASIYSGGSINPGSNPGATNHYNGSSWTSGGNTATDVNQYALAGTSTAAVAFGGYITSGPGRTNAIQDYDGSSWTANPVSLPANRGLMRSAGTNTACILVGGNNPPGSPSQPVDSLEWDGSSISTGPNNLVGMNDHCGWGTSTNAYFYIGDQPTGSGGSGSKSVNGYYYNGSAFVTSVNATTGKNTTGWAKSSNADSLVCGGNGSSSHLATTEEFTAETTAVRAVKTIDFD